MTWCNGLRPSGIKHLDANQSEAPGHFLFAVADWVSDCARFANRSALSIKPGNASSNAELISCDLVEPVASQTWSKHNETAADNSIFARNLAAS